MSKYLNGDKQQPARKDVRRALFCCCIIAGITFIAFSPSLKNGFTNWDDEAYVVDNPDIQGFTFHNLAKVFSSTYVSHYEPLSMLTYMAEYRFFQLNPFAYHCTNMLLHIINSLLVFALIYCLSGNYATALLVGLLFAVHPLRVESVAWISERKNVLSVLFYFLSLLFYLRYFKRRSPKYYGLSLLSLFLSLLSMSLAVSQPFVLLLIDYVNGRKLDKKSLLEKIPFFAIVALFAVIAILVIQKSYGPIPVLYPVSAVTTFCTPFYGVVFYLVKSVLPLRLCSYYPFPAAFDGSMNIMLLGAPFLVFGVAAAAYCFRSRSRKVVFGSLFFLLTALPMLQIVRTGNAIVAERYTYVPMIGACFIFAELYGYLLKIKPGNGKIVKGILLAVVIIPLFIFTCITHERCGVWNNSLTLWSDAIGKIPCAVAYTHRGLAYSANGDNDRAIQDYTQAIMFDSTYAPAFNNLGVACKNKGDYDRAIENYTRAIMLNPGYAIAFSNRGIAYKNKNDYGHAIEDYTRAIELYPGYAQVFNNRGVVYNTQGDHDRAIEDLTQAITLNPGYAMAYYNRGIAYKAKGDNGRSQDDIIKASELMSRLPKERTKYHLY
jgi:protein O-mannosyl-transferase